MIEVRLDEEVGTQRGGLVGLGARTAEALFPFGAGPIGDGGNFARELETHVGGDAAGGSIVVAAPPVGVHHEGLALDVAQSDAVGVGAGAAGDGGYALDAVGEEDAGGERLHPTHAGTDGGVEGRDAEGVEEPELRPHHVFHCYDGEMRRVALAVGRVEGGGAGAPVAGPQHVDADDEVFIRVERRAGADEVFPPASLRVGGCGFGVRGGGEAGEEEDGVGLGAVEGAPCFVGGCVRGQEAAPVEVEGVGGVVGEVGAGGVGWFGTGGGGVLGEEGACAGLGGVEAREREGRVGGCRGGFRGRWRWLRGIFAAWYVVRC